jgi:predicted nicotinamide N-methyase
MRFSSGLARPVVLSFLAIPALFAIIAFFAGMQEQRAAKIERETAKSAVRYREIAAARLRRKGNIDAANVWQP